MSANVEQMYSGEGLVPWWVGTEAGEAVVLDGMMTAMDARGPAGLMWDPVLMTMYTESGRVPHHRAITRSDTGEILGVVTDEYSPLSNELLAQVADDVVGGEPRCTTAGCLRSGGIVWYCMRLGEFQIDNDPSPIELHLVITTGHDGKHRCRSLITPIRVVCQNTLRAAKQAAEWEVSIWHHGDAEQRLKEATAAAKQALEFGARFKRLGDLLAGTNYNDEQAGILAQVLTATAAENRWVREQVEQGKAAWQPDPNRSLVEQIVDLQTANYVPDNLIPQRARNERDLMTQLIQAGTGIDDTALQGSAWAALQGVSEWADHFKTTNLRDGKYARAGDRRAESILWGQAADTKSSALDLILEQTQLTEQAGAIMQPQDG